MKRFRIAGMMAVGLAVSIMFIMVGSLHAGGHIKRGGTLNYIFGSKIPSYDLHRETTFGVIHPFSPYYSLLIRVTILPHRLILFVTFARELWILPERMEARNTPSRSAAALNSTMEHR